MKSLCYRHLGCLPSGPAQKYQVGLPLQTVLPFQLKYGLGHPENCLLLLSQKYTQDQSIKKKMKLQIDQANTHEMLWHLKESQGRYYQKHTSTIAKLARVALRTGDNPSAAQHWVPVHRISTLTRWSDSSLSENSQQAGRFPIQSITLSNHYLESAACTIADTLVVDKTLYIIKYIQCMKHCNPEQQNLSLKVCLHAQFDLTAVYSSWEQRHRKLYIGVFNVTSSKCLDV